MTKVNDKVSNIHWKQNMKPSKFLLCPNCKSNIPQLKIEITPETVSIEISCICQSKTITMPLKSFLSQSKEASSPPDIRCVLHSKPSNLFCIECSYWLCQDCIYLHQLCQGKSGKDHLITSTQVNIYCQLHQVKFHYYCKECNMNICRQCHSNDHLTHSVILLKTDNIGIVYQNLVSIDEVIKKNDLIQNEILARFAPDIDEDFDPESNVNYMNAQLEQVFQKNNEINSKLREFYNLYYQTAKTFINYPCYELMLLYTTLYVNDKKRKEDPKHFLKLFKYQKNHFMYNHALKQVKQYDCIDTLISHTKEVSCLVKLDNDLIASGSHDRTVKLWSIKDNMKLKTTFQDKQLSPIISIIQINNDILFTSTSKDEYLCYGMSNYAILNPSNKSYQETKGLSYPMIKLSNDQLVTRKYFITKGHTKRINHLIELNNRNILSVSYDDSMRIWEGDKKRYQLNSVIGIEKDCLTCVIKLSNGKLISNYKYRSIKIWNYPVMNVLDILVGHSSTVNVLLELKNGLLASGSMDQTIKLWELNEKKCVRTLTGHSLSVNCLVELDGRMLLSGSDDKTIKVWNIMEERLVI